MDSSITWLTRRSAPAVRDAEPCLAVAGTGFSAVLLGHLPRLRRYAIGLVGDVARADDLLQDCIERALKEQRDLLYPERIYGWLRAILHNLHIDEVRRRKRNSAVNWEDLSDSAELSVSPPNRDTAVDFRRAMDSLSADHRQILLLIGVDGMSYRDVGLELDLPIGTVMSRIARAREQLRQKLESLEPAAKIARRETPWKKEP